MIDASVQYNIIKMVSNSKADDLAANIVTLVAAGEFSRAIQKLGYRASIVQVAEPPVVLYTTTAILSPLPAVRMNVPGMTMMIYADGAPDSELASTFTSSSKPPPLEVARAGPGIDMSYILFSVALAIVGMVCVAFSLYQRRLRASSRYIAPLPVEGALHDYNDRRTAVGLAAVVRRAQSESSGVAKRAAETVIRMEAEAQSQSTRAEDWRRLRNDVLTRTPQWKLAAHRAQVQHQAREGLKTGVKKDGWLVRQLPSANHRHHILDRFVAPFVNLCYIVSSTR